MDGLQVGTLVAGRFQVEELIGEGGMCLVYGARHTLTLKRVALKVLRRAHAAVPATRRRFLREARAACAVRHPNVLEIDDVIELADSTLVLVMDRLEGESLARKLSRRGRLPLSKLAPIAIQVIDAVSAAHAVGIVHRDLKPENIFVARSHSGAASVKVIDFGIAKLTASAGDAARSDVETRHGALLGTPYYMAPEQVLGEADLDHRADIWSLGVILYEALSGVRPVDGQTVPQILLRVTRGSIVPLRRRAPDVPGPLADVIAKMLSVERSGRPSDLRDLRRILEECAARAPAASIPSGGPTTSNRTPSQRPVAMSISSAKTIAERRLPLVPVLAVAAIVGLGFVGAQAMHGARHSHASAAVAASLVGAELGRQAASAQESAPRPAPALPVSESATAIAKPVVAAPPTRVARGAIAGDLRPDVSTVQPKAVVTPRTEAIPIPPPEPRTAEADAIERSRMPSPSLDRDNPWAAPSAPAQGAAP